MTLHLRWAFAALILLLFAAPLAHATPPSSPWPQVGSDLPADPAVRFGVLPNGMKYAIRRNTTPKGTVSVRFRIDTGSMNERDEEQGIAHMLEHMAFRGSAHVADGEMVRTLQSLGLSFGADTNAFTYPTQTVYSFDMPKNDDASVNTSLMLMREIAGELNLTKDALDTERNVVLAEARLRDVPIMHLRKSDYTFLYGARTASALLPIGLESVIANATPKLLRDFYEAWYRPERATLMIVGDIDVDAVEAKIKAKFSDWKPKAAPRKPTVYRLPAAPVTPVKLFTESGAQTFIIFSWPKPYDPSPDNQANERKDVIRYIALAVVNQRLARMSHDANPPFLSAAVSLTHLTNLSDVTELVVNYRPDEGLQGLKAAERAWRDAVANGVTQDEVDQVVAQLRTFFQTNAAGADTTPTPQVISALLRSVDEHNVFTSAQSDLEFYDQIVKGLTAPIVNGALRDVFSGPGPLVFASGNSPLPGGEATVIASLKEADAAPVSPAAEAAAAPPWPYTNFGKPGTVVARRNVDEFGITYLKFSNGVTLTVKPTQLHVGQVLMNVRFGKGRLGLPRDHVAPAWILPGMFVQGGLRQYGLDDLRRHMADKQWGATLLVSDDEFTLTGQARASDINDEMQVLAAYVTDPAWQPAAFDQARIADAGIQDQTETSPSGILSREFYGLLHDRDTRWRAPNMSDITNARLDEAKAILMPAMQNGPLDIVIVGDTTIDQAIAAVAPTFGALPRRPDWGAPIEGDERFPAPTPKPVVLPHTGAPNQAIAAIAWPTQGFFKDTKLQRTLRVLGEIFSQRLLDELRTREGITYTPNAASTSSLNTPGYGFLYALAQVPPDKIETFYTQVARVVEELRNTKVSAEELERARGPRVQDIQKQQQTNEYWLSLLSGSAQDPRLLDVIRTTIPDLQSVTIDDVQKAARDYLVNERAYTLVIAPKELMPAAAAP